MFLLVYLLWSGIMWSVGFARDIYIHKSSEWQNGRLQIVNPASHNRLFHLFWSLHCSIRNMLNHMKNICGATRHGVPMVPRGFPEGSQRVPRGFPGFPVSEPSPPLKTLIQTPGASDSDWPISFSETVGELEHHHFYQVNHDKP